MQVVSEDPYFGGDSPSTFGTSRLFDIVDIGSDGTSILGCSTLYTRFWSGHIDVFQSPDDMTVQTKCNASVEFEGGVSTARLIPNTKLVIAGTDTGTVSLININSTAEATASVSEHDHVVSTLSVTSSGSRAVTGSFDRSLKVWHTDHLVCSHTYRPAHGDMIVSVSASQHDDDVMVSCSEDGQVIMWDLRMPKPAREFQQSKFVSRPSCVSFLTGRALPANSLMIGTVSGHLLQVDASSLKVAPLFELGAHSRPVRQICPASVDGDTLIATCAEDNRTVVASVDPAHPKIIYADERHHDVVKGLAWAIKSDSRRLYSCSWDGQVLAHEIAHSN